MRVELQTEPKLRVVTLVDGLGLAGGGETLAREVATRLDAARFESTLCVSRWSPAALALPGAEATIERIEAAGVRLVGLKRRSAADVLAWRPLVSLLRRERIHVLHAHKFGSNVWAAMLGTAARTPVVIAHEHTWSFEGQPVRRFLDRNLISRRVDAILAVSEQDRRRMIEIERIDPAKLILVPNGIPPGPAPSGRDVRAELGIGPETPVIGTVCALRPQKALDVLLKAAAALVAGGFPNLRVLIVGEGPERPPLERLVAELGLEEAVTLLGQRADVPDVLTAFDVAVCCSDFEGTPLSVLEYMEAALPVVATRVGGVPDLIEPGVHGLLVERRSPEGLAGAIGDLLRDSRRAVEMGLRGRERRQAEFGIDVTVDCVERIYHALAAGKRAGTISLER